ncbi:MAG: TonB-dependent receptor [Bryobacterales bacterium]|nr:TonB-dependent receptor [Bryobacterales bacterium]
MTSILIAWLVGALPLLGQTGTGWFGGTVTDPEDGVLQEAKVTLASVGTGQRREAVSGADGRFQFPSVEPGTYTVEVEATGFAVKRITEFTLSASETVEWRIPLSYETATFRVETVVSSAAGVRVQTAEAQSTRIITLKELETLPQIGRNPLQLALYVPGVSRDGGSGENSRVNGTRNGSTTTKQDGVLNVDPTLPRFGLTASAVNLDSIAEVRIVLSGGKAEYGRTAGAQIELVSQRGSNRFAGNLFHYHRNTLLNANRFFNNSAGIPRAKYLENTFGGSFGGPLFRNRTFFHLNFQGRETAQEVARNRTVPTETARAGVFRWRTPGGVLQSYDILANDPRRLGMDPAMVAKLAIVPLPNNPNLGDGLNTAGYLFNNAANASASQGTARVDHLWSETQRLFVRYSRAHFSQVDTLNSADSPYPGVAPGRQIAPNGGIAIGFDWQLRPGMSNETRVGRSFYDVTFLRPRGKGPVVIPSSFANPDFGSATAGRNVPVWEVNESLSWIRGKHNWKFGGVWQRTGDNRFSENGTYPNLVISRNFGNVPAPSIGPGGAVISAADRTRFENLYNDLLGRVANVNQTYFSDLERYLPAGTPLRRNFRWQDWGFYVQDDWRLTRRLHVNLGLRYELFQPPVEANGLMGRLNRTDALLGFEPMTDLAVERSQRYHPRDRNNLAPRAGFSFDPTGKGKTAMRGSFGVFYERGIGQLAVAMDSETPGFTFAGQTLPNAAPGSDARVRDGLPLPVPPASVNRVMPVTRQASVVTASNYLPRPYVLNWTFSVQHEIAKSTVLEASYVANRGVKLGQTLNVNQRELTRHGFLNDFVELRAFQATGAAVRADNALARMFGSAPAAIAAMGAVNVQLGAAGTAAENVDRTAFARYAAVGLPQSYVRLFPQFSTLYVAEASGRSYFDSLQVSLRRDAGWLRTNVNYMWSKNLDTMFGDNGDGDDVPMNRYDLRASRGLANAHLPHSVNVTAMARLPFGWGRRFGRGMPRVLNMLAGGWDVGLLGRAQSGFAFAVPSPVDTYGGGSMANYSGGRIGAVQKRGDGVWYLTAGQMQLFTIPEPGRMGTMGKGMLQTPFTWNTDVSVVKRIPITEFQSLMVRMEAYNVTNSVVFSGPNTNLLNPGGFGRISGTVNTPRTLQVALRYSF